MAPSELKLELKMEVPVSFKVRDESRHRAAPGCTGRRSCHPCEACGDPVVSTEIL